MRRERVVLAVVLVAVVALAAGWASHDVLASAGGDWVAAARNAWAAAGDAGKVALGAMIGAVGAWIVAHENRADAREAREEARTAAAAAMFLPERRAAIVEVLSVGEAIVREAGMNAWEAKRPTDPGPRLDALEKFRRAWMMLALLAPDLTSGDGVAYAKAVKQTTMAYWRWTSERLADAEAKRDFAPAPEYTAVAEKGLESARLTFLIAAMNHLGVPAYTQPALKELLANQASTENVP